MASEAGTAEYWRARLGRKVSLRFKLRGDPVHPFSEAIGMVAAVTGKGSEARVSIVNRRGEHIEFGAIDVIAAKDL